jgi:hypothetical protein
MSKERPMRRIVLFATLGAALAAPAATSAFFTPHFDVIEKTTSTHGSSFTDVLLDPANPTNEVGHDRGSCKEVRDGIFHCRAKFHLDGELGGQGTLRVSGNAGERGRLNVTGGSGDFNGAAGKVVISERSGRSVFLHFDLVR